MLDLKFEHEQAETRGGSQNKAPGGPSNRCEHLTVNQMPILTAIQTKWKLPLERQVRRLPDPDVHYL
jgi:hypothetical protein